MSIKQFPGGIVTKNPTAPTTSSAPGIWTLDQVANYIKQGIWPSPPLVIGQAFGGGFYAGQISTAGNGIADYNLVVGPRATAQSQIQWKTSNTGGDPTSVINGPANSATMNSATYPAAQFCEGLTIGGFSDWYMPAKNELELCYYNLKSFANTNNTNSGSNTNAVPSRASNYTGGNPARTTATLFQGFGSESFTTLQYWASTEASSQQAWSQDAYQGYQNPGFFKNGAGVSVRAVRRVAV
jgi:hypothetical protein